MDCRLENAEDVLSVVHPVHVIGLEDRLEAIPLEEIKHGSARTRHRKVLFLRCCKKCTPIGKLRDRDVQAARNMHRATVALINGRARPAHLCRAAHDVVKPVEAIGPSTG